MTQKYIENLLLGICEKLQLTPTLYNQATERYQSIAKIIQSNEVFNGVDINIYPQGSFRLKTTVKPLSDDEYDLDFVAELSSDSQMDPKELYDCIYDVLKNDGIHNDMIEPKSRCIRVKYANDFHLDIMPGKLLGPLSTEIIVPDKELTKWYHHSNPIAFADWFEEQAKSRILFEMRQVCLSEFNIEDVTEQDIAKRMEPLRRAVQLVKRYRDIYCEKNEAYPVRSIVICTLMGMVNNYSGDTIQIIQNFCDYVNALIKRSQGKPFEVKNPVVNEVLTEKWSEGDNYNDFVKMMNSLTKDVAELRTYSINSDVNQIVKKMFGETVTNAVITDFARTINEARTNDNLSVTSKGIITTENTGTKVKKNTFYGEI